MQARGDGPNNMLTNGEARLQRELLRAQANVSSRIVAVDVGANVGEWTLALLEEAARQKLRPSLEIHAFEPVPATFHTLQRRLQRHAGAGEVKLICEAVSRQPGTIEMFVVADNAGTNSIYASWIGSNVDRILVPCQSLDSYLETTGLSRIDLVKCDAEGHDMEVLLGAEKTLRDGAISVFQFEYNHRWIHARHYLRDVFDLIEPTHYVLGKLTSSGIQLYRRWHPELERFFEGNYALLHRDAADSFSTESGDFDDANTYSI